MPTSVPPARTTAYYHHQHGCSMAYTVANDQPNSTTPPADASQPGTWHTWGGNKLASAGGPRDFCGTGLGVSPPLVDGAEAVFACLVTAEAIPTTWLWISLIRRRCFLMPHLGKSTLTCQTDLCRDEISAASARICLIALSLPALGYLE